MDGEKWRTKGEKENNEYNSPNKKRLIHQGDKIMRKWW